MTGAWGPRRRRAETSPGEAALLAGASAGERGAVEKLYAGHVAWARRAALLLAGPEDAERLVSESFARALGQLRGGTAPAAGFGPHLLGVMGALQQSAQQLAGVPLVVGVDTPAATAALAELPKQTRRVVWLAEVEGRGPDELAELLATKPTEVPALVDRARDRVGRAYLEKHGSADPAPAFAVMVAGTLGAALGSADDGARGLGELPGRTALTVAAAVIAVVAITATSWGLSQYDGEPEAAPTEPETTDVTYGPNPPAVPPPTDLPTPGEITPPTFSFPTPSLPGVETPSAPALPSFPTPSAPAPTYPVPTYPVAPPASTPTTPSTPAPTSPTTSAPPAPVRVWPVAPTVTKITGCGTYGSVRFTRTVGVRYELTVGNGRQGRWVVRASARNGFELARGATDRFHGNLGRHEKCPTPLEIRDVSVDPGVLETDPWTVTVTPVVPKKEERAISVTYVFATEVVVAATGGEGWTCLVEPGQPVGCAYDGTGRPPAVSVSVTATDEAGEVVPPSGTVGLFADGQQADAVSFGGDAA